MGSGHATTSVSVSQVLLAAGDTFRAAAAEQLQEWASRAGAEVYAPRDDNHRPEALLLEVPSHHYTLHCQRCPILWPSRVSHACIPLPFERNRPCSAAVRRINVG